MSDYAFYAALLRFVARKAERPDARVAAMMDGLEDLAAQVESAGFTVPADRLDLAARALAGVAGFVQQRILPEALAHGNQAGERQLRWSVDASLAAVNRLLAAAVEGCPEGGVRIDLPPPPET